MAPRGINLGKATLALGLGGVRLIGTLTAFSALSS